jgi:hypothetical protein
VDVHWTSAPEAGNLRPGRAGSRGLSHDVSAYAARRRRDGSLKSSSSEPKVALRASVRRHRSSLALRLGTRNRASSTLQPCTQPSVP